MFEIELYEDARGRCPVQNFYVALEKSGGKNAEIQSRQFRSQVKLLEELGTWGTNEGTVKHLHDKVWELRPGKNRILFFHWKDNTYVLLHAFVKTTNKTPPEEINRAKREIEDWIKRHGQ